MKIKLAAFSSLFFLLATTLLCAQKPDLDNKSKILHDIEQLKIDKANQQADVDVLRAAKKQLELDHQKTLRDMRQLVVDRVDQERAAFIEKEKKSEAGKSNH